MTRPSPDPMTRKSRPALTFIAATAGASMLACMTACYRPADEWVDRKNDRDPRDAPAEGAEPGRGESVDPPRNPGSGGPIVSGSLGGTLESLPAGEGGSGSPEEQMRDLFARHDLGGLDSLDQAIDLAPDNVESLLRGAFAGVGNETSKCEEILLYLTVRHPEIAVQLADAAARANAGIGTAFQ